MRELKPCPFCGNEPEMIHAVLEEYHSVDPEIICRECGYRIKAKNLAIAIADSPKENCNFLDRQTIRKWNTRPLENDLTEKIKLLRETLAEVARMANNSDQEQIFEKCRDVLRDLYLEEKFKDSFDKILHGKDSDVPANEMK